MANRMYIEIGGVNSILGKGKITVNQAVAIAQIYQFLSDKLQGLELYVKLDIWLVKEEPEDKKPAFNISLKYTRIGRAIWDYDFFCQKYFRRQKGFRWDAEEIATKVLDELLSQLDSESPTEEGAFPEKYIMHNFLKPRSFAATS